MTELDKQQIVSRAEEIYERRLKAILEKSHVGQFLAIEPISGDHFLGMTLREAGAAARKAHPGNPSFILRIGHRTAVKIGTVQ